MSSWIGGRPGDWLKSKRDPSSQKALLWMTANCGWVKGWRLGEADRFVGG
jgi:hypothetical protein